MVNGGSADADLKELSLIAAAADHYGLPVFEFLEHVDRVRRKYGEAAAEFEVEFALAVRDLRIERMNEAIKKAGQA